MAQGFTGAGQGAARAASTASVASLTLPAGPMIATYPISGVTNITSITAAQDGRIAMLEFASTGCRVVMGGNLLINGDYLSTANGVLMLIANGGNWEEVTRTSTVLQPYNACPNGDAVVWQRGTSFAAIANGTYTADRWAWVEIGSGVATVSQSSDVPAVAWNAINTPYSILVTPTTIQASYAAGDLIAINTTMEGYDYRALTGGFAVSFWVKAHLAGTYCLAFCNATPDRSYVAEYQVLAADTWEYKTIIVPTPPTAGGWNYLNGIGLRCYWTFGCGTTRQTTPFAWQTGNLISTTNQVNMFASTANTFRVWGFNIVPGTVPQPLMPMPFALQIARLRRYCQKIGSGSGNERYGTGTCSGTTICYVPMPLDPPMVGTPTATFSAVAQFGIFNGASLIPLTAIALSIPTPTTGTLVCTTAGSLTSGSAGLFMDTASGLSFIIYEANPA